jgi:hypothetical protein
MMEAARTSETSVDNHFIWQYNPEDSSELYIKLSENAVPSKVAVYRIVAKFCAIDSVLDKMKT